MIVGLIPVGGKGLRMGLPFCKELLPQKGFDYYNPLINHTVSKMVEAGAEQIYFVHGSDFKQEIVDLYSDHKMFHIKQTILGFANVLKDFMDNCHPKDDDKILFGLPDSVYEGNLFKQMVKIDGIVCGLFTCDPYTKVDRLDKDGIYFQIKTQKNESNQKWFWGCIKFDGLDLKHIIERKLLEHCAEIGDILNKDLKTYVYGDSYIDLGTWPNYNRYLTLYEDCHDKDFCR